ncbi:MAG: hypothetical protein HQ580_14695 [Planctomycetes bacterium]|nr:hypothetical protein [Planctomycetota bacterium]
MKKAKTKKNVIRNGYVILARVIRESAIWQDSPDIFKLFLYLLIEARHDKKPKRFSGFEVKRGELVTSLSNIAEDNQYYEQKAIRRWSRPKVARMLEKLKEQERIKLIPDTYGTHISICKYEFYQNPEAYKADNTVTTPDNTVTTPCIYNNGNNGNNDNKKNSLLHIFNHWNTYKGQSISKLKDGKNTKITWHSHKLKSDGTVNKDAKEAIAWALKDYSVEDICGAIDNYAKVLLGINYFWTHKWSLPVFLTVGEEKHKQAARKWYRFKPDNFIEEQYLAKSDYKQQPERIVKFENDEPSKEFLKRSLDGLLKIPEPNRTAKDREEIRRLQVVCGGTK